MHDGFRLHPERLFLCLGELQHGESVSSVLSSTSSPGGGSLGNFIFLS